MRIGCRCLLLDHFILWVICCDSSRRRTFERLSAIILFANESCALLSGKFNLNLLAKKNKKEMSRVSHPSSSSIDGNVAA